MVTTSLWILVHVGGPTIYSNRELTISLWFDNGVQEGDDPILLVAFHCELNGWVNTIYVLKESLFVIFPFGQPKCYPHT